MKKFFPPIFCACFALIFCASAVFAQTNSIDGSPKPTTRQDVLDIRQDAQDVKTQRQETRAGIKDLRTTTVEERKAAGERFAAQREEKLQALKNRREELARKFQEKRAELLDRRYEKVVERIEKITTARRQALERLDLISQKIQLRIDKLAAEGRDVSAMQSALDACQTTKSTASVSIDEAETGVSALDFNATNAKDLAQAQVSAIQSSNQALKSYHACLTNVIKSAPKTEEGISVQ
ncbi:MAG: hypothetical protein WD988_01130 [Candidatus Curtissbacteria bacterium]